MPVNIKCLVDKLERSFPLSHLVAHRDEAQRINNYYSPRARFNRWRDSEEGQSWKRAQYLKTEGICPDCGSSDLNISDFAIDHKKPLSKFPELATVTNNLQLLCHQCNVLKSDSTLSEQETVLFYLRNPLDLIQIAARLGVGTQCIQQKLDSIDISFKDWSVRRDPIGIPWVSEQDQESSKFYPAACFVDSQKN